MARKMSLFLLFFTVGLLVSACSAAGDPAPSPTAIPTRAGALLPFPTLTATRSPTPPDPSTPTPLPTPTPTPITHVVKKGEDLFGIALRYHVTLDALKTANPTVQPNFLSIGTTLVIPYASTPVVETPQPGQALTPTPLPLVVSPVHCLRSQDRGLWCFLSVQNPGSAPVEGAAVRLRLAAADSPEMLSITAYPLLDVIPPAGTLPIAAFVSPDQLSGREGPFFASAELISALPGAQDGRYLPAAVDTLSVQVAENGLSAEAHLNVRLVGSPGDARRVWVLASAYDASDRLVGLRRWENSPETPLTGDQLLPVVLEVYSAAGAIERVTFQVEARP